MSLEFSQCLLSPLKGSSSLETDETNHVFETPNSELKKRRKKKKKKQSEKEKIDASLSDDSYSSVNKSIHDIAQGISMHLDDEKGSQESVQSFDVKLSPVKMKLLKQRMTLKNGPATSTPAVTKSIPVFKGSDKKSKVTKMKYECPEDFLEVEIGETDIQVWSEDIDDQTELWLIKAPSDFDIQSLNGKNVNISSNSLIQKLPVTDSNKCHEIQVENKGKEKQSLSLCPLLPSKDDNHLIMSGSFQGEIRIQQTTDVPLLSLPSKSVPKNIDLPKGLKFRLKAFGVGNELDHNSKSELSMSRKRISEVMEIESSVNRSSKPKKKKKKKSKETTCI